MTPASWTLPLVAALALALPAAAAAQTPSRLVVGMNADIRSLEPGVNRDSNTDTVIHQIFEGLVAYRRDLTVGPALADSWQVSDEGRTYTFTLRDGATFHNGKPVTSAEVKWMWERLIGASTWACRAIFDGRSGARVAAVEAPDPRTVVFRLDRASGVFLKQLANIQCHVVAAHPEVVARLQAFAEKCRAELGDTLTQRKGAGTREPGRVEGAAGKKKAKSG